MLDSNWFEWAHLLGRWLHIITGITWIGTSIFFMWLDRSFEKGELWMVHGGGFYQVKKHQMGPTPVPEHLHWFKWESYWTWMSGVFLLLLLFYSGGGTFLLDSSVSQIGFTGALILGLGSIVISWLFYDFLWDSGLAKSAPRVCHAMTLAWVGGVAYLLCHTLSGRGAYIHVGAMLGTWMTANVFLRIIPRQVQMVEASKRGEAPNQEWPVNAKNRSTHNSYFTLPVILIMLSNHFPNTYGHPLNWIILLLMGAGGAAIRHAFIVRVARPSGFRLFAAVGVGLILMAIGLAQAKLKSAPAGVHPDDPAQIKEVSLSQSQIKVVVEYQGAPPQTTLLSIPPSCSGAGSQTRNDDILVSQSRLQNVLVFVSQGLEGKKFSSPVLAAKSIDQKGCMYHPRVLGVRVGQAVRFLNSDPVFHNVRTVSTQNEVFNLGMPKQNDVLERVFSKPEIAVITKCDVHPWMKALIGVFDHPFFGVSDQLGEAVLTGLPKGHYMIEARHEVFGSRMQEIDVKSDTDKLQIAFTYKEE